MAESKPDKPHILVEYYVELNEFGEVATSTVVSVNQLVGIVFLPQVAGAFFHKDCADRAEQLAFHIASISGLDIVKVFHKQQ